MLSRLILTGTTCPTLMKLAELVSWGNRAKLAAVAGVILMLSAIFDMDKMRLALSEREFSFFLASPVFDAYPLVFE